MRASKKILPIIAILIAASKLAFGAYQSDDSWKIFDDTSVGVVKIIIDPAYLNYLLDPDNADSDSLFAATCIFQNAHISTDTIKQIGFRLRGNTSREAAKKSFKVDLNHFVPGRQFYGMEKLNLNGEHNDPSIMRAKLCWDLFQAIDLPASRANHVRLYINDVYRGLYLNVEHVDEEFVRKRFGNNNGNLYKCLWPADLVYLGADQKLYKNIYGDRRAYELQTNKDADDYADLVHFIDVLNNTPAPLFRQELEKVLNVDNFLKWLALNVLVGSWDDYWYLKNNYYLYHNTATGRFEFIPYDYDNTYGIDWININWGRRDIYHWGNSSENRPLVTRILAVPEYWNTYTNYLSNFMVHEFAFDNQEPNIDRLKALITPAVEADSFRILDWDFSIGDFHGSFLAPVATIYQHVRYGIKPYIQTRISTARDQLQYVNLPPVISWVQHTPDRPEPGQAVQVNARVTDDDRINTVNLYYRTAESEFQSLVLLDDGNHNDGAAGDSIFGTQVPPQAAETVVYYYVAAWDNQNASVHHPIAAPGNAFFYLTRPMSDSEVLINLHFNRALAGADVGVGLLGSFNDWSNVYPMHKAAKDFWEISLFLAPGSYIYKFVTYRNLNGTSGVTEWITDPDNSQRDGPPYFNSVLTVTDPMIYYMKPADQDTLTTVRPVISAQISHARTSSIDTATINLRIDQEVVVNTGQFFDTGRLQFDYRPANALASGYHRVTLGVKNSQGNSAQQTSDFWVRTPLLFINEFLASNRNTQTDEAGESDDWIELHNGGDQTIDLKGMFLTDDFSRPTQWQLPDTTLAAGKFLLIWADGDTEQGPLHTNFKLSAGGEQIGLFSPLADGNFIIDTLTFHQQKTDTSWGRYPETSLIWSFMLPTPAAANKPGIETVVSRDKMPKTSVLYPNYPNPFNQQTCIRFDLAEPGPVSLRIFNISGQVVRTLATGRFRSGSYVVYWYGDNETGNPVASGTYFYQYKANQFTAIQKMVLLR